MRKRYIFISLALVIISITGCGLSDIGRRTEEIVSEFDESKVGAPIPPASQFAGGSGTQDDPYQIADAGQLAYFAECINSKDDDIWLNFFDAHYILVNDIVLNDTSDFANWSHTPPSYGWIPIGRRDGDYNQIFEGSFDGQNHTISGMYLYAQGFVDNKRDDYLRKGGLFGAVRGGSIINVKVSDSYIYITDESLYIGGLIGDAADTMIDNCVTDVVINGNKSISTGGVVGNATFDTTIQNCTNSGNMVVSSGRFGGIVGLLWDGRIVNCRNTGFVKGLEMAVIGGIAGEVVSHNNEITIIQNNRNEAEISSEYISSGIIGNIRSGGGLVSIENNYNSGTIRSQRGGGGLFGSASSQNHVEGFVGEIVINNCHNEGDVITAIDDYYKGIGGIIGSLNTSWSGIITLSNSTNSGNVSGNRNVGGIIGGIIQNSGTVKIENCVNESEIKAVSSKLGGIIGNIFIYNEEDPSILELFNCTNEGAVISQTGGDGIGGIVGKCRIFSSISDLVDIEYQNCINIGNVTVNNLDETTYAGGIIGYGNMDMGNVMINGCNNSGNIRIDMEGIDEKMYYINRSGAGGIVGAMQGRIRISNSVNTGTIGGTSESITVSDIVALSIGD